METYSRTSYKQHRAEFMSLGNTTGHTGTSKHSCHLACLYDSFWHVQFQRNALGVSWALSSFFIKSLVGIYRKCSWSSLVSFEHSSVSFWSEVDGKCSQPKNRWDMFLASTLCADSLSILYSIILENQWEMSLVLPEPNPPRFLMKYLLEMYVGCPWSSLR